MNIMCNMFTCAVRKQSNLERPVQGEWRLMPAWLLAESRMPLYHPARQSIGWLVEHPVGRSRPAGDILPKRLRLSYWRNPSVRPHAANERADGAGLAGLSGEAPGRDVKVGWRV